MASDGTRVFVLGGSLSSDAVIDETAHIHVLDTSMYFLVISFGWPPR
jgi:hypothetical protein